jgi:hypothetical protein
MRKKRNHERTLIDTNLNNVGKFVSISVHLVIDVSE